MAYDDAVGSGGRARQWNKSGTASAAVLRPMLTFARTRGVNVDAIVLEMPISILGGATGNTKFGFWGTTTR